MAFILGLYSDSSVKCFETTIPSLRTAFGRLGPQGRFRCRLPAVPLAPGHYCVDVGLYPPDWGYVYDYHWHMHPLAIVADERAYHGQGGVVALQPSWAIDTDASTG